MLPRLTIAGLHPKSTPALLIGLPCPEHRAQQGRNTDDLTALMAQPVIALTRQPNVMLGGYLEC